MSRYREGCITFLEGFLNDSGGFVKWLLRRGRGRLSREAGMSRIIEVNNRALPLIIRRTSRKKSIGVELTCRQEVIVRVPRSLSEAAIQEGVNKCLPWLTRKLAALPAAAVPAVLDSGRKVLVLGEVKELVVVPHGCPWRGVIAEGAELHVALPPITEKNREAAIRAALADWYRTTARGVIDGLVRHYSAILGVVPPPFSITSARRRWGSCGANGRLNFAWRLAMAPLELIEYVVVHELCHLKRRDHSAVFWTQVAALLPDYPARRNQLHRQGILYDL